MIAAKEVLYIREALAYAGFPQPSSTPIYDDNDAACKLAQNPVKRGMTKHIARRFHFLRQCDDDMHASLIPTPGLDNIADIFTKPLGVTLFNKHRLGLGLRRVARESDNSALLTVCLASRHDPEHPTKRDLAKTLWENDKPTWKACARDPLCVHLT